MDVSDQEPKIYSLSCFLKEFVFLHKLQKKPIEAIS